LQCSNYEIIVDERTLSLTCSDQDNRGNIPLSDLLDISGLHYEVTDDLETLLFSGDLKVMMDIPPRSPITMQMDVYRWQRSQWLPTGMSLKRENLCQALNDPREFWHSVIQSIPRSQRQCPPKKEHIYTLTNVSNHQFVSNMPSADIAGDLKAVVHFAAGSRMACASVFVKVYNN
ncbi:hypothetical protein KR018_004215, partial [Drosophila ironensis]